MARSDSFSTSPIVGTSVLNGAGEDIGTIFDVVCESFSGRLRFALVGLRHETALLVVPWEAIQFHPDEPFATLNVAPTELAGAPRLERSEWPRGTDPEWDREVYAYYGCRPYWEEPSEERAKALDVRRRRVRRRAAFGAIAVALVIGLSYWIAKQGFAMAASQVYGVAAAVKETTAAVRETSTDAATTAKAKTALALSKRVSALEVNVDTSNAVATLTGRAPTFEVKELAGQIVAGTSGVREVRNLLTVDPTMRPPQERLLRHLDDLETQIALSEAIQDNPELDRAKVKVRVVDGSATLEGTVGSDAQKARAEELARTFPGVQRVNSRLE